MTTTLWKQMGGLSRGSSDRVRDVGWCAKKRAGTYDIVHVFGALSSNRFRWARRNSSELANMMEGAMVPAAG